MRVSRTYGSSEAFIASLRRCWKCHACHLMQWEYETTLMQTIVKHTVNCLSSKKWKQTRQKRYECEVRNSSLSGASGTQRLSATPSFITSAPEATRKDSLVASIAPFPSTALEDCPKRRELSGLLFRLGDNSVRS